MPPTIQDNLDDVLQRLKPTKTYDAKSQKKSYPERLYRSDQISIGNSLADEPSEAKDINNFDDLFGIEEKP
jgi:hypothetical protein